MKVAGFTFIRNAVKNDYPIVEAITSILPICDEFVVAVGNSDDETEQLIKGINSPKIKIIHTTWDESIREGGTVFADETDKAFAAISADADWAFYIQGDECVHEKYLPIIKKEMENNYGHSRRWYRREIRIVRNNKAVHSYRDAQGFRWDGRKIQVKLIDAYIYHYGWVKPPEGLTNKLRNFNRFYHDDEWMQQNLPETFAFDYTHKNPDRLIHFTDKHPAVMQQRIASTNWNLNIDLNELGKHMTFRRKVLQKIEDWTGWRISEYRNYKIVK
jgi:hypothetical protein